MKTSVSGNKGFGLIEIMVVVAIIGILAGGGVTATQHMRGKAQNAKVATEVHSVRQALEVDASTEGGFPNPFPSPTRRLYCVGSTECAFKGKAVPNRLPGVEGMPEFPALAAFSNDWGLDQGYIYMTCDDESEVCAPEDTALLYGTENQQWLHWLDDESASEIDDDFDWGDWGIDWDSFDDWEEEEEEEEVDGYVCAPPEYPYGSFEAFALDHEEVMLRSPYCTYDSDNFRYVCSNTCETADYHFQTIVLYESYPYLHTSQDLSRCVEYEGTVYCDTLDD